MALGLTQAGGMIELFTTPAGETWTLIVTSPRGLSCLVASGQNWQDRRPKPKGMML